MCIVQICQIYNKIMKLSISIKNLIKKNEKSLNQNGLIRIGRIRVKKGQRKNLSQTKKIQNIVKNIFQNKIKQIKKNANLLQNTYAHVKKRKRLF